MYSLFLICQSYGCPATHCTGSMLEPKSRDRDGREIGEPRSKKEIIRQAKDFLKQYFDSVQKYDFYS